ncbi:hypothetical protein CYLTODRAFT_425598 [Cylindrobasidium torrendii FP15055 ss-10]|uniref:Nucleoporin Nup54 alpha-helical domain-containing protein n=1 Tax=Cylindrobasidium torrendii FP15055 ss-10 TaxID=1314674 RepID=A0A0D7B0L3_9AGAR|nr:hypothetical protein CYLTODRAFT_425598 [Cylindrobasidium torrendii FP15055 ss-10]
MSIFGASNAQPAGSTGTSLFGSSTPSTGGSLFGQTNNATSNSGGSSLFGQNNNNNAGGGSSLFGNKPAGSSLFGQPAQTGTQQPATGGGLFGTPNAQNQQQQGDQAKPAGSGLFGASSAFATNANTANAGTSGTSLFGSTNNSGGGGGLFGSTNNNNTSNNATSNTDGGLFGSSNTNTGGGLFGSSNTNNTAGNTGGGLFGSSTTNNTNTGGGLFGSSNTNNSNTGGGGLFGSTNNNASNTGSGGGGLFGSTNNNASNTGGGGLFGTANTNNTNTGNTGSSLFPSSSTNPLFGSTSNNTLGASTLSTSAFGKPAQQAGGGLLRSTTGGPLQQAPADAHAQFETLKNKMEMVVAAWNPSSPQCRFQHYFYNLVDPSQVHLYGRPANATNDALWQRANQENPDSSCLVPVIANGFGELRMRVDAQKQQSEAHTKIIEEIRKKLDNLTTNHTTTIVPRLARYAQTQMQIAHKVSQVVQHLHLLLPSVRSSAIRPEEEQLAANLEITEAELKNRGKLAAKVDELWAVFSALKARDETFREQRASGEWKVVDEEGLARVAQILAEQQAGLAHLTKILQRDLKDLGVIYGFSAVEADDESMTPENLWSSTNTLRASVLR